MSEADEIWIECVPNFSEGRNTQIIEAIAESIRQTNQVKLLHIDIGYDANRTVMTFVGNLTSVVEGAFNAINTATKLIDMRNHCGEHPRFGSVDVCPFVPLKAVHMKEAIQCAHRLAKWIEQYIEVPIYMYEKAALAIHKTNLAKVRAGEYEGIPNKLKQVGWKPDYGCSVFNPKTGCMAIGARFFLVAYNINLNTSSVSVAKKIARELREIGYTKKPPKASPIHIKGKCKGVKAIGWYMPKYGCAQVSTNIVNINQTNVHKVYEACKMIAEKYHVSVNGSELIGLIPLQCMLQAGHYYAGENEVNETTLVHTAIEKMGLNVLFDFNPQERIIDYLIRKPCV